MDSTQIFYLLVILAHLFISGKVGDAAHARGRNRNQWTLLSLLLSPILAGLLLLLLPDLSQDVLAQHILQRQQRQQAQQIASSIQRSAGSSSVPPPPSAEEHYRVAHNGTELGQFTLQQLAQSISTGHIAEESHYWDQQEHQWLPLACLRGLY